jgi:hypothetical protein
MWTSGYCTLYDDATEGGKVAVSLRGHGHGELELIVCWRPTDVGAQALRQSAGGGGGRGSFEGSMLLQVATTMVARTKGLRSLDLGQLYKRLRSRVPPTMVIIQLQERLLTVRLRAQNCSSRVDTPLSLMEFARVIVTAPMNKNEAK